LGEECVAGAVLADPPEPPPEPEPLAVDAAAVAEFSVPLGGCADGLIEVITVVVP